MHAGIRQQVQQLRLSSPIHTFSLLPSASTCSSAAPRSSPPSPTPLAGAPWLEQLLKHSKACLPSAQPHEATVLLLALSQLRYRPGRSWMAAYYSRTQQLLQRAQERSGSSASSSASSGNASSGGTDGASSSASSSSNSSFTPQGLALTLRSLALLRLRPPRPWLADYCAAAQQLLPSFAPRDAAQALHALALLPRGQWQSEACMRELVAALVKRLQRPGVLVALRPRQLVNVAWALEALQQQQQQQPSKAWRSAFSRAVLAAAAAADASEVNAPQQQLAPAAAGDASGGAMSLAAWAALRLGFDLTPGGAVPAQHRQAAGVAAAAAGQATGKAPAAAGGQGATAAAAAVEAQAAGAAAQPRSDVGGSSSTNGTASVAHAGQGHAPLQATQGGTPPPPGESHAPPPPPRPIFGGLLAKIRQVLAGQGRGG